MSRCPDEFKMDIRSWKVSSGGLPLNSDKNLLEIKSRMQFFDVKPEQAGDYYF